MTKIAHIVAADLPPVLAEIDNTEAVEAFRAEGGGIIHIRPKRRFDGKWSRGMTFAFKAKGSRIEFSSALQHKNDCFTKKAGTQTALAHFRDGKTVTFPMLTGRKPVETIRTIVCLLL